MTQRPRRAVPLVALAVALAAIAAAPASDPVATDACGDVGLPAADPDAAPAPAGETVPALDVCALDVETTWRDVDDGPAALDTVAFTVTMAGDVADRPAGATYAVGWTGPNQGRECYHVIWLAEPVVGDAHAEVGGSCQVSDEVLNSYEFLDGTFPAEAVAMDERTVTFTIDLATADPTLLESIVAHGTLARPTALTYLNTGVPDFYPLEALWDVTTVTRDVVITPPA